MSKDINNYKKPIGLLGSLMINHMNKHHYELTNWGLSKYDFSTDKTILDIGCGGGNTIYLLLNQSKATVYGIDYSVLCVKKSLKKNRDDVKAMRAHISYGNVLKMDFSDNVFDTVTAVETIYFWQPFDLALLEVLRVLHSGGRFIIIVELTKDNENIKKCEELEKRLNMNLYTENELVQSVCAAGFKNVAVSRQGPWLTLEAVKP